MIINMRMVYFLPTASSELIPKSAYRKMRHPCKTNANDNNIRPRRGRAWDIDLIEHSPHGFNLRDRASFDLSHALLWGDLSDIAYRILRINLENEEYPMLYKFDQ